MAKAFWYVVVLYAHEQVVTVVAMQAEGVTELTQKGFIDWCRNGSGYERKHLYDDKKLNEAVQVKPVVYHEGRNGCHGLQ